MHGTTFLCNQLRVNRLDYRVFSVQTPKRDQHRTIDFVEMMKSLGYQRLISIDNFRSPNFELVADVLFWLVSRYDPTADISSDISTQDKRVDFLKSVATLMATKARVKLNLKQLYRADGYAVKELLKIASVLYDAVNSHMVEDEVVIHVYNCLAPSPRGNLHSFLPLIRCLSLTNPQFRHPRFASHFVNTNYLTLFFLLPLCDRASQANRTSTGEIQIGAKLEELKKARVLASEIVDSGAKLYSLLGKEEELRKSRSKALAFLDSLSMNLESNDPADQIERNIREQINIISDNVSDLENLCVDLEKDQKSLKVKIERKQQDLERAEKR